MKTLLLFTLVSTTTVDALGVVDRLFGIGITSDGLLVNNRPFTLSTLNHYLYKMEDNPFFVPDVVQDLLFNLPTKSKMKIVDFINDVAAGRVIVSNDPEKIGRYIAKRVRILKKRFSQAKTTALKNLACFSQDTRDKLKEWYQRGVDALATPRKRLINAIAVWLADVKDAFDEADDSIKDDIRKCEPAAYRLISSEYVSNFAEGAHFFSDAPESADIDEDPKNPETMD